MNFNVTPEALEYIKKAKEQQGLTGTYLRIGIQGEGCCGPSYKVEVTDLKTAEDHAFGHAGLTVIIDKKFEKALDNAEMVTVDTPMGTRLKINNPNVTSRCSCHPH